MTILLAAMILYTSSADAANTYCVAPDGSNTNPGTESMPLKTAQKGIDQVAGILAGYANEIMRSNVMFDSSTRQPASGPLRIHPDKWDSPVPIPGRETIDFLLWPHDPARLDLPSQ